MSRLIYPPSDRRAKAPFELIHSDLKSFPFESYHKFRYVIVFYDDFSSNAWTIPLKKKSDAVKATTDWLMYVTNSHSSHVK